MHENQGFAGFPDACVLLRPLDIEHHVRKLLAEALKEPAPGQEKAVGGIAR